MNKMSNKVKTQCKSPKEHQYIGVSAPLLAAGENFADFAVQALDLYTMNKISDLVPCTLSNIVFITLLITSPLQIE